MAFLVADIGSIVAYDKNGLRIIFACERSPDSPLTTCVTMTAHNNSAATMSDFLFQAAVPKVNA